MSQTTMGKNPKGRIDEGQVIRLGKRIYQTAALETCLAVKLRLIELVKTSNSWLNDDSSGTEHVSGDWDKERTYQVVNLPYATVDLTESPRQMIYGRRIPSSGTHVIYDFTIHLLQSACAESGESRQRYAHQIADDIYDQLDSRRDNESPQSIWDIHNLSMREVPMKRTFNLVKMEIIGKILASRSD